MGGTAAGLFDVVTAQGIVKSLGMGLMMGFGVAVVLKDILPQVAGIARGLAADSSSDTDEQSLISGSLKLDAGIIGLGTAAIAVIVAIALDLGPVPAVIVTLFTFVTTIMSAQSCGQTGIDPWRSLASSSCSSLPPSHRSPRSSCSLSPASWPWHAALRATS